MKAYLLLAALNLAGPFDPRFWQAGDALVRRLRQESPKFEGVVLRDCSFRDLDGDGTFELVETVNVLGESAPGWLNDEIEPAFALHRIYVYHNGQFTKDFTPFADYLERRIAYYEFWKRQIEQPGQLSEDSQGLVKANRAKFQRELDRLIALMRQLQQPTGNNSGK